MAAPGEIFSEVYTEELVLATLYTMELPSVYTMDISGSLHHGHLWTACPPPFLWFWNIESLVIQAAPRHQLFHLSSVCRFVILTGKTSHSCVISQPNLIMVFELYLAQQWSFLKVNNKGLSTQPWGELVISLMTE